MHCMLLVYVYIAGYCLNVSFNNSRAKKINNKQQKSSETKLCANKICKAGIERMFTNRVASRRCC